MKIHRLQTSPRSILHALARRFFCAVFLAGLFIPPASAIDIPLQLDLPPNITADHWPVTFGVPFPKNVLQSDHPLVITADGKPIATQITPLATWTREGKDVRWLLVDAQIDAAHPPKALRLTAGNSPTTKLKHRLDAGVHAIDTGATSFRIQTQPVSVSNAVLAEPMRFTLTDHRGVTFTADGSDGLIIEDEGPVRIALKSEGWYRAADGATFCRHVTRLQFFADSAMVRVLHTFIMTETGADHQIRDIAIDIPVKGQRATFGIDADDLARTHVVDQGKSARLVQDCIDRWHPSWQLHDADTQIATGERYGGWMNLSGPASGVTVAIREAWQNYPNELEARDGRLIAHLWPLHGRMLDFRTRAVLATYGEDGVEAIDKFFLSQNKPYAKSIDQIDNNAMGVAKTHELWLDFHDKAFNVDRAVRMARQANAPVLVSSDPAWNCSTGALLESIHPRDLRQFPEVEAMLDACFDRMVYWQQHFSDYGFFDYGDVHCDARGSRTDKKLKGGVMATPWRYWDSTHYGLPNGPWTLYFRSGDRKYLQFAEANTRHCMDIDRCHFGDGKVRLLGTHYYCDWSIIHWNGVPPTYVWLTTYDKLEYLAYAYYMRGDRRALDVMKTYGEAVSRYHDDTTQQFPLRILRPTFDNLRHFGPTIGNMTELYRITWEPRYLQIAADYARAITSMTPDDAVVGTNIEGNVYCLEGISRYLQLTGDEQFLPTARLLAAGAARRGSNRHSYEPFALAWQWTSDTAMLDHGKALLMQHLSILNVSDDPVYRGDGGYWASGNHPFTLRSLPVFLAAMAQAPQTWRDANLPLVDTNVSVHLAGPRHPTIYIKPTGKGEPRVLFQLMQEQAIQLNAADALIESPQDKCVKLDSKTLKPGQNVITFPLRPTRKVDDYIDRGNVDLVAVENAQIVLGPGTDDGKFCLFGPRLYFFVPQDAATFTVTAQVSDTWAAYAWKPIIHVFDPAGNVVSTQTGPGTLTFKIEPAPEQRGRCWSIGPIGRVSAPQETATWNKPPYPFDKHFPSYLILSNNLPQYLTTRPDLFFLPD